MTNQSTAEQAGPGALLLADNAPADQAVVDELVLLAQALAGVTSRDEDSQLVLPLLGVQADILGLLLRGTACAADSTAALLCLRNKTYTNCTGRVLLAAKRGQRPWTWLGRRRQAILCVIGMKLGADPRRNKKTSSGLPENVQGI